MQTIVIVIPVIIFKTILYEDSCKYKKIDILHKLKISNK